MRIIIFILVLMLSFQSVGENKIYKTVHADGSITYSDQPSEGAVEVTLNVNMSTINSANTPTTPMANVIQKPSTQHVVRILSPASDATIRNNAGTIKIAADLAPTANGLFELTINNQTIRSTTGVFSLSDMDRGSYSYSVKFISTSGKVIASSETRELHLHKASVLINNRAGNP